MEKVLADFFSSDDPMLGAMPEAFWDLAQGTVRPGLDDRVVLEASFSPARARGTANLSLFYRLPSADANTTDKVLGYLDRRSTTSGYYRFGRGQVASLRGSTRVRTSIVGHDAGESYLVTSLVFSVRALPRDERDLPQSVEREETHSTSGIDAPPVRHEPA